MDVEAIAAHFSRVAALPQRLGVYDCCTFVVEVLLYGFGRDFRDQLGYYDRRSAVARLRGAGGLRDAFCSALGDEQLIADCPAGSIAYFEQPASVGVVMPGYIAVKANRCIHRFVIEQHRTGWRTD